MKEKRLEIGRITFESQQWDNQEWDRVSMNYTNYGNHCGDSSTEVSVDVSENEAAEIVKFLMDAYPRIGKATS